jgi:hypothetical protein
MWPRRHGYPLNFDDQHRVFLSPKIFEPIRRQLGVTDRVLDILMAEIGLQGAGIVPFIGQREAPGVTQHVGVSLETELGSRPSALHKPRKPRCGERCSALGGEHERRFRLLLTLEPAQGAEFIARMGCVLGLPFFTLRTARVPAMKSIWSQRRSTSSLALKP